MNYGEKWPIYARQWDAMSINPERVSEFERLARFAIANKARYQAIEARTQVPWPMIAVLHRRESDADFTTYLGNGEPLNRVTRLVPRGRGPFSSFEAGAEDALRIDGLSAVIDWRLEKMLYYCEIFNGTGYNARGLPSPYIWGGTNQQKRGKYVADGRFDPNVMDSQPGCAPILKMIAQLDPSVHYIRETSADVDRPISPQPTPLGKIDLARAIPAAAAAHGAKLSTDPTTLNIVYVAGVDPDGTTNKNRINAFDDLRIVLQPQADGSQKIVGIWEATIETGVYYTEHSIAEDGAGAARITFGQQKAWQVGLHRGYEALVQTGGAVSVARDKNQDYKREGDKITTGWYGINQHHAFDAPRDNIGYHSAGCLVGRTIDGHHEFMNLVKTDARYKADHKFIFDTTVMPVEWLLQVPVADKPVAQTSPTKVPPPVKKTIELTGWAAVIAAIGGVSSYLGAHPTIIVIGCLGLGIAAAVWTHIKEK